MAFRFCRNFYDGGQFENNLEYNSTRFLANCSKKEKHTFTSHRDLTKQSLILSKMSLKHDYFIIESLADKDINDGKIFYDALTSTHAFHPVHKKVKTLKDFEEALVEFSKSNYKYLFVSAHGDDEHIILKAGRYNAYDLDDLKIDLSQRRIFMSTCRGGSFLLAKYFIKKGAYSVIGCPDDLDQIVAAGMWTTMAVVFIRLAESVLDFKVLNKTLKLIVDVYHINLTYYSFVRNRHQMKGYSYSHNSTKSRSDYPL